jgi:hypothetical protein
MISSTPLSVGPLSTPQADDRPRAYHTGCVRLATNIVLLWMATEGEEPRSGRSVRDCLANPGRLGLGQRWRVLSSVLRPRLLAHFRQHDFFGTHVERGVPLRSSHIAGGHVRVELVTKWSSNGEAEQLADEESLTHCIAFDQPSDSAFPDHVHRLDALHCPPPTLKRRAPLGQPCSLLQPGGPARRGYLSSDIGAGEHDGASIIFGNSLRFSTLTFGPDTMS